jgi:NADH:ubiquinone oxidoreductase subunit H
MSTSTWGQRAVHLAIWLVFYLLLLIIHWWFERWLLARFQNRRASVPLVSPFDWSYKGVLYTLVALGGILTGALIPLTPPIQIGQQQLAFSLFGQSRADMLYVIAVLWASLLLLTTAERRHPTDQAEARRIAGTSLLCALPVVLIVLSLIATGGAISSHGEASLHLGTLIELQDKWGGLQWLGLLQPLAFVLWLACTSALRLGAQARATMAGQVTRLNLALLTCALFLGGWQGPFVESLGWLGLLYTLLKLLCLTFIQVWVATSIPRAAMSRWMQTVWTVYTPVSALNLMITAAVVVIQSQ